MLCICTKNYEISKVKNAKAGVVKRLEVSVRGASRNLAEARSVHEERGLLAEMVEEIFAPPDQDGIYVCGDRFDRKIYNPTTKRWINDNASNRRRIIQQQAV